MTDGSIAEHVKQAAEISMGIRKQSGELQPMMHLVMPGGEVVLVALAITGAGRDIAHAARQVILRQKPQHAILIIEGWTTRKGLPIEDRDYRAIIGGALMPSQLPPHKRGEQLTVLGESANGDEAFAMYYIEDDGSFSETLTSWNMEPDGRSGVVTHFRPMFLDHWLLRSLNPNTRAVMVEWLGSEKKLLHMVNRMALKFLQATGPVDPKEYTEQFDRLAARAREEIGWRKR